jgi:hypothetical protein
MEFYETKHECDGIICVDIITTPNFICPLCGTFLEGKKTKISKRLEKAFEEIFEEIPVDD